MTAMTLEGGFADPALDAARAFRGLMEAMARPGTLHRLSGTVPPAGLSSAAGIAVLTLCDGETPIHLAGEIDSPALRAWIAFHTGAPVTGPETCVFALGRWQDLLPLSAYPVGTPDYPDRSATLIVETDGFDGPQSALSGPGIDGTARLALPDPEALQANHARFPLGLDFFFTHGDQLAALPRSTEVS